MIKKILKLLIFIILVEGVGLISGISTIESIPTWYQSLNKPFFNPPNWIFGPVWTTLYFFMGVSLYLIWSSKKKNKYAIKLFIYQISLNFLWSIIFFGLKMPLVAFIELVILLVFIYKTTIEFAKINKIAGYLFIPYILWVSFAGILNLSIVLLNR